MEKTSSSDASPSSVARLSATNGGLESIDVAIDGHAIGRWSSLDRDGYHDYSARIPADPARPPVGTITFHFHGRPTDDPLVRLDRIWVHA